MDDTLPGGRTLLDFDDDEPRARKSASGAATSLLASANAKPRCGNDLLATTIYAAATRSAAAAATATAGGRQHSPTPPRGGGGTTFEASNDAAATGGSAALPRLRALGSPIYRSTAIAAVTQAAANSHTPAAAAAHGARAQLNGSNQYWV